MSAFSDRRMVSHDSAESNYRMASDTLLQAGARADGDIHPVPTDLHRWKRRLCATTRFCETRCPRMSLGWIWRCPGWARTVTLRRFFPGSRLLAGVDDDFLLDDPTTGPLRSGVLTASLDSFATERLCAAVSDAPKPPAERVTMTPPC